MCCERASLVTWLSEHCSAHTNISCFSDHYISASLHGSAFAIKVQGFSFVFSCISTEKFRWRNCSTEVHSLEQYCLQGSQVIFFLLFLEVLTYAKEALGIPLKLKVDP